MSVSNLQNMCRFCMSSAGLYDIFKRDGKSSISMKVASCIQIKVNPEDGLPSFICSCCKQCINQFYNFKQKCVEVDLKLRAMCQLVSNSNLRNDLTDDKNMEIKSRKKKNLNMKSKTDSGSIDTWLSDDTKSDLEVNFEEKMVTKEIHRSRFIYINSNNIDALGDEKTDINVATIIPLVRDVPLIMGENKTKLCQCDLCGRTFKSKCTFKNHMKTHTGEKIFKCELCSKRFARAESAKIHMRAHLGIKPFICEVCGRAFTRNQDLLRHLRIHSDEKKYSCSHCERKFKRSHDVSIHMRTHTGARPYACKACDKRYTSHSSLRKHYERHCKKNDKKK